MKYSYYLEGTTVGGATYEDVTFNVDFRTLIPVDLINREFILRSSFSSKQQGSTIHSTLRISINYPSGENKSNLSNGTMVIGFTKPQNNSYNANWWSHQYTENECMPKVVGYPTFYPVVIDIYSYNGGTISASTLFGVNLSWELLPED